MTRVTKLIRVTPGKHIGRLGHQDPGEFPEEVKALFEKAVEYYEENMALMVEIQVRQTPSKLKINGVFNFFNFLIFKFYSNMSKLRSIQTYLFICSIYKFLTHFRRIAQPKAERVATSVMFTTSWGTSARRYTTTRSASRSPRSSATGARSGARTATSVTRTSSSGSSSRRPSTTR